MLFEILEWMTCGASCVACVAGAAFLAVIGLGE